MSAASEKAAREWREPPSGRRYGRRNPDRWYVQRIATNDNWLAGWAAWASMRSSGLGRMFSTHAEAIAYATEQARKGRP